MTGSKILLASLLVGFALGCGSVDDAQTIGSTSQAMHDVGTIYVWYYPQFQLVAIHTCPIEDTTTQLANEAAGGPESMPCDDGTTNILSADVKVLDAKGATVAVIHADGPGGGCVHVSVPSVIAGGSLQVHAVVKGMPGTGSAADVFDRTILVP